MADVTDTFYAGEAFIGYKSQLKVGQADGSPETFTAVADVMMIEPGNTPAATKNKTHLRSPGRTHEKLATLRELGPFKFAGNYRPGHGSHKLAGLAADGFAEETTPGAGDAKSLPALHRSLAENNFELEAVDSNGTTFTLAFRGVVTDYKLGQFALEEKVEFTCEIQPLSDWTAGLP